MPQPEGPLKGVSMQKRQKKLQIHRETVLRLDRRELSRDALAQARGGIEWTGCMSECTECGTIGGAVADN
jgi:hypothetical protein